MRLFIAIPLGEAARGPLERLAKRVRDDPSLLGDRFRFGTPAQYHLTMRFLGEVADGIAGDVVAACGRVRIDVPPTIHIERLALAPMRGPVRLIVGEVGGDVAPVIDIARQLGDAITSLGIPPERRPFWPHVTVARARMPLRLSESQRAAWRKRAGDPAGLLLETLPGPTFMADQLQVVESRLESRGAIHTPLATFRLDHRRLP